VHPLHVADRAGGDENEGKDECVFGGEIDAETRCARLGDALQSTWKKIRTRRERLRRRAQCDLIACVLIRDFVLVLERTISLRIRVKYPSYKQDALSY
jgi:hypothetical protein